PRRFSTADSAPADSAIRTADSAPSDSAPADSAPADSAPANSAAGRFSASLNDFDFKKFRPFFTENYVSLGVQLVKLGTDNCLQKYSTTMGYFGFKPPYIGKNTSKKNPQMPLCAPWASGSASRNNGYWGFKPIANCKNTSKEPLKCHFVHLGPSGSASRNNGVLGFKPFATCKNTTGTMGYWGFKPFATCKIRPYNRVLGFKPIANCKNTSKEPLKSILCTLGPRVPPAGTMGYWGFKPFATCKIRERTPQMPFYAPWSSGSASHKMGYWVLNPSPIMVAHLY
ncbi:Hypothetical protein FKW44_022682, partial [Caligus rogercresseyi]